MNFASTSSRTPSPTALRTSACGGRTRQARPSPVAPAPSAGISTTKSPKSPNAFILFRSHILRNPCLLPPEARMQKDKSRYVAWIWRELPDEAKREWFERARDEKERRDEISYQDSSERPYERRIVFPPAKPNADAWPVDNGCHYGTIESTYAVSLQSPPSSFVIPSLDGLSAEELDALVRDTLRDFPF